MLYHKCPQFPSKCSGFQSVKNIYISYPTHDTGTERVEIKKLYSKQQLNTLDSFIMRVVYVVPGETTSHHNHKVPRTLATTSKQSIGLFWKSFTKGKATSGRYSTSPKMAAQ